MGVVRSNAQKSTSSINGDESLNGSFKRRDLRSPNLNLPLSRQNSSRRSSFNEFDFNSPLYSPIKPINGDLVNNKFKMLLTL